MQNKIQNSLNYLASPMFNTSSNNPINELNIDDITYIQAYLEKIKTEKINSQKYINKNFTNNIGYRNSEPTRNGKKNNQSYNLFENNIQQPTIQDPYNYHNPYEYGNKQNIMKVNRDLPECESFQRNLRNNRFQNDRLSENNIFSNDLKDINVESSLQRNMIPSGIQNVSSDNLSRSDRLSSEAANSTLPLTKAQGQYPQIIYREAIDYLGGCEGMHSIPAAPPILQMTKQRMNKEKEIDRFNILPYDPQDTNHIIWNDKQNLYSKCSDNISRGHPTRNDRLDDV